MNIFSQNKKIKKSSDDNFVMYNFGIPALKTCPMAQKCASGCYATQGAYAWPVVKAAYEARYQLTLSDAFIPSIIAELNKLVRKHEGSQLIIRVHDAGDFYSPVYQQNWYIIAQYFPKVKFYAYTKMVKQSKALDSVKPLNFRLIYSFGGREDNAINPINDFHSKVFNQQLPTNYIDGTKDDKVAALGENKNIGLLYHGQKSFNNTRWGA